MSWKTKLISGAAAIALAWPGLAAADEATDARIKLLEEQLTLLQGQIAALTARQQDADVDALVKPALADGRLLPAMEKWARDLGKTDVAALTAYLGAAQPIAALTATQTKGIPPSGLAKGDAQLSADELAVCTAMGLTPDQYKAGAAA